MQQPVPVQQKKVKRKKIRPISAGKGFALGLLASIIISTLMAVALIFFSGARDQSNRNETDKAILDQRQYVNEAIDSFSLSPSEKVRNEVLASVANITVTYIPTSPKANQTTHGSGVIFQMSPDQTSTAYVMTNYHVLEEQESIAKIYVTIQGVTYEAKAVGAGDPSSDIAVLRIDNVQKALPPVKTERTEEVQPGEWCMAVSNPHGFNDTITVGTISAVGRNIPRNAAKSDVLYANMLQTDAATNPGSSGGGLWDSHGQFLGMISLIWSSDGGNEGIGFAIPKKYALTIAEALVEGRTPAHAVIGASLDAVPADIVASYGLQSTNGAYITAIESAGAAERANLAVGDIIKSFDGRPIETVDDVILIARGHAVNDSVEVVVSRKGKEITSTMILGSDASQ